MIVNILVFEYHLNNLFEYGQYFFLIDWFIFEFLFKPKVNLINKNIALKLLSWKIAQLEDVESAGMIDFNLILRI